MLAPTFTSLREAAVECAAKHGAGWDDKWRLVQQGSMWTWVRRKRW